MILNKIATFGNIFRCLHFIASKHPNFNIYINKLVLALIKSLIVSGTYSWRRSKTAVAPIK